MRSLRRARALRLDKETDMLESLRTAINELEDQRRNVERLGNLLGDDFPFVPEHIRNGEFLLVAHSEQELRKIREALRKVIPDYRDRVQLVFSSEYSDEPIGIARYITPLPNLRLSLEMPIDKFPRLSKNCRFEKVEEKASEKGVKYRYTCSKKES